MYVNMNTTEPPSTNIADVFKDTSVFITGGTGFMGKMLTEKLLRSCPDLKHVYLLVREKKGKDLHQRLDAIFQDPLFSVLEKECPKFRYKVCGISGDISAFGLNISKEDRERIVEEVGIIFHAAATVRFDEGLKTAYAINIQGTKEMVALVKEIKNLKAFVHVSTAYANSHLKSIDEKLYEPPMCHDRLERIINSVVDDELLAAMLPKLLGSWPNTYTYTKAVAEDIVKNVAGKLPVTIFRPAIVVGTAIEPIIGWTDNVYGPTGLVVGAGCGVVRTIQCDLDCVANIVPVDMCVNSLIASAWECAVEWEKQQHALKKIENLERYENEDALKIYNYVSSVDNPLKWSKFKELNELHGVKYPTMQAIWYYCLITTKYKFLHQIYTIFLHYIPALIMDSVMIISRKDTPRLVPIYRKIDKFGEILRYFALNQWNFDNKNVKQLWEKLSEEDKKKFPFDMRKLDWDTFFRNYIKGLRQFLLKEDMNTLPQAMIRWRRFYWAHQSIKAILAIIVIRIVYSLIFIVYSIFNNLAAFSLYRIIYY